MSDFVLREMGDLLKPLSKKHVERWGYMHNEYVLKSSSSVKTQLGQDLGSDECIPRSSPGGEGLFEPQVVQQDRVPCWG